MKTPLQRLKQKVSQASKPGQTLAASATGYERHRPNPKSAYQRMKSKRTTYVGQGNYRFGKSVSQHRKTG